MFGPSRRIGRYLFVAAILVLASCAPATPTPAAPTAVPKAAAPTAAPKPAATTAPAAAKPTAAATTAPAAKPAATAAPKAAELIQVQMGLVSNLQYVPVFVGVEKGIFNKHGLDAKIKLLASGPEASKALEAGDVDVGAANFATLISARSSGAKLKGVWLFANDATVAGNDNSAVLIVPPGSPIQKVSDLAGKRVGITVGGANDPWLRLTLQEAGVDPSKVEIVNAPFASMPAAVAGGGLDAAGFSEPYGEIYLDQAPGARVLVRGGGKVSFRILAIVREDWLPKNQAIAEKLATALAESQQYVRQHVDEAGPVAARWLSGLKAEVARKAIAHYVYDPRVSNLVVGSWDQEGKTLLEQKRVTQLIPLSAGFDTTLAQSVPQKYPQFFSDLKALPK